MTGPIARPVALLLPALALLPGAAAAAGLPTLSIGVQEAATPAEVSTALQVLLVLTVSRAKPASIDVSGRSLPSSSSCR